MSASNTSNEFFTHDINCKDLSTNGNTVIGIDEPTEPLLSLSDEYGHYFTQPCVTYEQYLTRYENFIKFRRTKEELKSFYDINKVYETQRLQVIDAEIRKYNDYIQNIRNDLLDRYPSIFDAIDYLYNEYPEDVEYFLRF